MKALRLLGLLFLVAMITGAVGGCSQSHQVVKGGSASPAQAASTMQKSASPAVGGHGAENDITVGSLGRAKAAGASMMALKDIHYDFDKYDIRPKDAKILKQDSLWIERNAGTRVKIEGNCDERGTVEYNMVLGQERADAAKRFLVNLGVEKGSLETISYGKEKPIDPGHDEQAWEQNRRSHFVPVQ